MGQQSLKARRIVYDHLISTDVAVAEFPIKRELIQSCKAAHSRYCANLEQQKDVATKEVVSKKRKLLQEELASVKKKKIDLESVVTSLEKDVERFSREAEKKDNFVEMKAMVTKRNAVMDAVECKRKTIKDLETISKKLDEDIKSL